MAKRQQLEAGQHRTSHNIVVVAGVAAVAAAAVFVMVFVLAVAAVSANFIADVGAVYSFF